MAKASRFAYTSFAAEDSIYLEVSEDSEDSGSGSASGGGIKFKVSQVTTSFPVNGIPQATVMIAVGRDARNPDERAKVHDNADLLKRMKTAKVYGSFEGQYRPDHDWPEAPDGGFLLFDGYLSGFTYRKLNGKLYAMVHINHWLVDLVLSSSLSAQIHPQSASDLRGYAVQPSGNAEGTGAAGAEPAAFLSDYTWFSEVESRLETDLWDAAKYVLDQLAGMELLSSLFEIDQSVADLESVENDRAKRALERIEGPEYDYGNPIKLSNVSEPELKASIAAVLGRQAVDAIKHNTLWDILVGVILPTFGLEIWPMVDKAVIAPSLPAYRDSNWREISANEFISIDTNASIPKPVRGVMVYGASALDTIAFGTENPAAANGLIGFAGHGKEGSIILVSPPPWLARIPTIPESTKSTIGLDEDGTIGDSTNPPEQSDPPETAPDDQTLETMTDIMNRFADMVYVQSVLRGRTGTLTGRLRYDIGPGCHIKIQGSPEKFLGGEDDLGGDVFAQVNRVTVSINADGTSPSASTSFGLSYVRSVAENEDETTSLDQPPYYEAESMVQGVPLVKELDLDGDE